MADVNPFSEEELAIAMSVAMTPELLIHAQRMGTAALSSFGDTIMLPVFEGQLNWTDKELALGMVFYRLLGVLRTLVDLDKPYQFQTIAGATRSAFELCVDVALLCGGKLESATDKFHGFTKAARYQSAHRLVAFYRENPHLEDEGDAEEHRLLVESPGGAEEISTLCLRLWQRRNAPEHWSGLRWSEQVAAVGAPFHESYLRWSPLLAWQVHGGGAGVGGLSPQSIRSIESVCRDLLKSVVPIAFRLSGVSMHMHRAVPEFFDKLEFVSKTVETYAGIDARLQTLGRKSKFSK